MVVALLISLANAGDPNVRVEILDRGVEPRVSLATSPAVGTVERIRIDLSFAADVVNEGIPLPTNALPPLHLTLRSEVVRVDASGIRAAITVPEVEVRASTEGNEDVRAATAEAVAPMRSVHGMVTLDPLGAPMGAQWSAAGDEAVDPTLLAEVQRAVELLQIRRPSEPLGVGARWTVTRSGPDDMGFTVTDTETWTVASREGARWILEVSALQRADVPQELGPHTLKSHTGAAQGRAVLDLQHLHPASVELGLTLRTRMLLEGSVNSTTTSTLQATATREP